MFSSYLKLALRNLFKNKLYASINVFGLAIALTIFVFAIVIAKYENSYDSFFENADRIYTVNAMPGPNSDSNVSFFRGVQSALPPILRAENDRLEGIAQVFGAETLTRYGDKRFFQHIQFVERDFFKIFDFDFVAGNPESAIKDPSALILTESAAEKYFGEDDPLGKTIILDNRETLEVRAIIKDLPNNSHFSNNLVMPTAFEIIAPIEAWVKLRDYDLTGNWSNLSGAYMNYVLLPEGMAVEELQKSLDSIYANHVDDKRKETLGGFTTTRLVDQNNWVWNATGMPVIESLQILGGLILLVACLNYTNLATAQALGRLREVGLRKSLGASKGQLFGQFLIESTLIATLALFIALGLLELITPLANDAMGKEMSLNLFSDPSLFATMVLIVVTVGLISGGYPAYVIANVKTSNILRGTMVKGSKGVLFRNIMLVIQFMISIFMMTMVAIIYMQNQKVSDAANIFPKDQTLIIKRINQVTDYKAVLKNEISRLEGVEKAAFIRQEPFEQSDSSMGVKVERGGALVEIPIWLMNGDEDFFDLMGLQMLAGRQFSRDNALDRMNRDKDGNTDQSGVNVILNESAMRRLGFESPAKAIHKTFINSSENFTYTVVGVVKDVNYMGFFNSIKPYMFRIDANSEYAMAIKIKDGMIPATVTQVEEIWNRTVPDRPIQRQFLNEKFDEIYKIFQAINGALFVFAVISFLLAGIGLFGMAAFMAEKRTREIGIRKVMGANIHTIVKMLVWQFSKPVVWALAFGLTLGYLGSFGYLQLFQDRVDIPPLLFVVVTALSLGLGWITVSFHAWRVANSNPIHALRYE